MIWDMSRLELETSLTGHSSAVAFLSFSPDGTVLAASEKGGLTKVWNTSTWDSEHELFSEQHKANVVAFPRTNGHVAYAIDTQVKLCDLSNDSSRVLLDQPDFEISSLAFSPDGDKLIAAGGSLHGLDGELYLVDVESGETLRSFHGNRKPVRSAAFLSNGQKIATASGELVARFWSETANPSVSVVDLGSEPLIGVSFLPDEAGLLCVGLRNLTVVDPVNFKVKDKLPSFIVPLKTFALSPDGTLFACGDFERNIYLLNLVSNTTVAKLGQFQALVKSLSFSPDGKFLAAAGGMETEEMSVWRLSDRKLVGEPKGHDMTIFSLIVSPDGSVAATASGDNNIKLWNPKTWQETMTLSGADNGGVNDLAFSFDSLTLASAAGYERRIKIWDTLTGNLLQTMESNSESITSLAFGSTNNLIASGSDQGTVYIWDVNTGRELLSLSAGKSYITSLSFSPSQTELLATTSSGELLVWRAPRETAQ